MTQFMSKMESKPDEYTKLTITAARIPSMSTPNMHLRIRNFSWYLVFSARQSLDLESIRTSFIIEKTYTQALSKEIRSTKVEK
ncbi:hypothetical protein AC579_718 [Pseudocercospora musae]|uniref:Uncharacterized protein n=1 Tax=Pseudocercospora musae TaxID=113226 RepID=A0A139I4C4_9PEZI|nr:hypothetical protein AC579_718 [Pseudocercospora musae]